MKKDFVKIYEYSLPLINQAIEALRRLHEAEAAGHPAEEIRVLRVHAESLFQAVSAYQLRAMGVASAPLQ
ncbi:hypothetical protein [Pseudomonas putida]|uniref:hypothetical protein n=1 Tax=Pseudomonas putida TaxID=303 RepID=UPI00235CF527|nr:hypothetical protein [Pseudomonas putida]GLO47131.1 hypothetical protein PPUN109347_36940 [Pseudomonas putida]HDS0979116.1 hypothetical protein [Pseudomonas putida]